MSDFKATGAVTTLEKGRFPQQWRAQIGDGPWATVYETKKTQSGNKVDNPTYALVQQSRETGQVFVWTGKTNESGYHTLYDGTPAGDSNGGSSSAGDGDTWNKPNFDAVTLQIEAAWAVGTLVQIGTKKEEVEGKAVELVHLKRRVAHELGEAA